MPRRYTQRPWDATEVKIGDPIYLVPTGNRTRFYPAETLPVVARVVDVKRVYAYLKIKSTDREPIKMRRADGVVADDGLNSGWLTFRMRLEYDIEMSRRERLNKIRDAFITDRIYDIPADAVKQIYDVLLAEDAIKFNKEA